MIVCDGIGSNLIVTDGYGWPMYVYLVAIAILSSEEYVRLILDSDEV